MTQEYPDHPLWDYALELYARPGVSAACIAIQERHVMDVNMFLFSCWYARSGQGRLSPQQIEDAHILTQAWNREVVCVLRAVRDRLDDRFDGYDADHVAGMRKSVLGLEIECEHSELLALAGAFASEDGNDTTPLTDRCDDAIACARGYYEFKDAKIGPDDLADLLTILGAAFPEIDNLEDRLGN